ncbi:MAG: DUF3196 family protein [Erysipelotrichia bacterium]|nr:DUF3196 family protein [Erysipelotrichia bacterium]
MDGNYYTEMLKEIAECIGTQQYERADSIIKEEYKMPFIPHDVEKKLSEFEKEIYPYIYKDKKTVMLTKEEIYQYLKTGKEKAYKALEILAQSNVRLYLEEVKKLLVDTEVNRTLKSLLIQILVQQQVDEEIEYESFGEMFKTVPKNLPDVLRQRSVETIENRLHEIIYKQPVVLQQCLTVMVNVIYDCYPQLIDINETDKYAFSIIRYVYLAYGDMEHWNKIKDYYGIDENSLVELTL